MERCQYLRMEALSAVEVFHELRELQAFPGSVTEPVDVPLLAQVLVKLYASQRRGRLLAAMHRDTLTGQRCHCTVKQACVCNAASWYIQRCWLKQATQAEVWMVACSLADQYALLAFPFF